MPKHKSSRRRSSRHPEEERFYHKHRPRANSRDRGSRDRSPRGMHSHGIYSSDKEGSSRNSSGRDSHFRESCTQILEQVRNLLDQSIRRPPSEIRSPSKTVSFSEDDVAPSIIPVIEPFAGRQTVAHDRGLVPGMSTCRPTFSFSWQRVDITDCHILLDFFFRDAGSHRGK